MKSLHTVGLASRLAKTLIRGARWPLPWLFCLWMASTIAFAADYGLERTSLNQPMQPRGADVRASPTLVATIRSDVSADVSSRWITLSSVNANGTSTRVACLVSNGLFAADAIQVSPTELLTLTAARVCDGLDSVATSATDASGN